MLLHASVGREATVRVDAKIVLNTHTIMDHFLTNYKPRQL